MTWEELRRELGVGYSERELRGIAKGIAMYHDVASGTCIAGSSATRILAISDAHIPYHLPLDALPENMGRVDILVLNGDLMDCQALSRFPKEYRISPVEEMVIARDYVIRLIDRVKAKKVVVNYGNHEKRLNGYLTKRIDPELMELMPDTPLEYLFERGFTRDDRKNGISTYYNPITEIYPGLDIEYTHSWYCRIGKTVFAHPLAYSSPTLKTTEKMVDYLHATMKEPFDAVVLGHTHHSAESRRGYITLYEQGAMCNTERMSYMDGKLTMPQQRGYMILSQDKDGSLIPEETRRFSL